jgi:hypothetical protein
MAVSRQTVADLERILAGLLLPVGVELVDSETVAGSSWEPASILRRYAMPSPAQRAPALPMLGFDGAEADGVDADATLPMSEQLRIGLLAAGWQPLGDYAAVERWPVAGGVRARPSIADGDGVMLTWNTAQLDVRIVAGWVR